jgi:glycosyltransferase involved in cell wall biosynthesis
MEAKRICVLISEDIRHSYPTLKLLADELVKEGFRVDFFSRCLAFKKELEDRHLFRVKGYNPRGPFSRIEFLLRGFLTVGKYDAYIGVLERGTILGRFLAGKYKKPFIAYMPEVFPAKTWSARLSINSIRKADAIIDVDPDRHRFRSRKWNLSNPSFCINNVLSRDDFSGDLKPVTVKNRPKKILWYHGYISSYHGIDMIVDGFCKSKYVDELHLTGQYNPSESFRDDLLTRIRKLNKPIFIHDPVPRKDVLKRASESADIAIGFYPFRDLPPIFDNEFFKATLHYANPAKIFDYMALGIPAITSDNPSLLRIVQDEGWGICVPPENAASVAEAIDLLANNEQLRFKMSHRAKELFKTKYNLEKESRPFIEWLNKTI